MENLMVGAAIVITFVILAEGVKEWRAERRWWKRYQERKKHTRDRER